MRDLMVTPDSSFGYFGSPMVFAEDKRYERSVVHKDPISGKEFERKESPIVWLCKNPNLIVDLGRKNSLKQAFGVSGTTSFGWGSVGDSNADPSGPSGAVKDRLGNEIILDDVTYTGRRPVVSLDDDALADGDFTLDAVGSNRYKVVFKFIFPTDHPSNGETYAEFGVHSDEDFPTTGTDLSGVMLARFVPNTSFDKDEAFQVTMQWTMRS